MDITSLYTADSHADGSEMTVCDETNKPLDMFITLAGPDSEVWQQATRDRQKRAFSRAFVDGDDNVDYDIEELVAASLGWRGFEQAGAELEFSKENIRQLYKQAPYIKDQAIIFVHTRANFTKG